MSVFFAKF